MKLKFPPLWLVLLLGLGQAAPVARAKGQLNCGPTWKKANLTHYESFPEPGSQECLEYNGCRWTGRFFGLEGPQTPAWVEAHNLVAVHRKDWKELGGKQLKIRQGSRSILVTVMDLCSDDDCQGCCTKNLGGDGFLIDMEKSTWQRFGLGEGLVEFQVCE